MDFDLSFTKGYSYGDILTNHWEILTQEVFNIFAPFGISTILTFGSIVKGNFSYNKNLPQKSCSDYELNVILTNNKIMTCDLGQTIFQKIQDMGSLFYPNSNLFHIDIRYFTLEQIKDLGALYHLECFHEIVGSFNHKFEPSKFDIDDTLFLDMLEKMILHLLSINPQMKTVEDKYLLTKFVLFYDKIICQKLNIKRIIDEFLLISFQEFKRNLGQNIQADKWHKIYSIHLLSTITILERFDRLKMHKYLHCLRDKLTGTTNCHDIEDLIIKFINKRYHPFHPQRYYFFKLATMQSRQNIERSI